MNYPTFKEHLTLLEARKSGVKYTEKQVKNVLDKVTATLSGTESASMTKLAKRYARLEASMKAMKEKHEELNTKLKGDVQGYFDAEDVVLTRVVETAQFTLTMAKEVQKGEGTKTVDYEKVIAALSALIPEELQSRVDSITEKYTTIVPPKAPIKRLSVSKEVVSEGLLEKAAAFFKSIMSWATRFDGKLEALKRKAGMVNESLVEATANELKERFKGHEYMVWFDENAGKGGTASYASRNPFVVYQGGNPGDDLAHIQINRYPTKKEADAEAKRLNDLDRENGVTKKSVSK